MNRFVTSVTVASGGVAAAASLTMGVAAADATSLVMPINPFGIDFIGEPNFSYHTDNAYQAIAYGQQSVSFNSDQFTEAIDKFFAANGVEVNGAAFNAQSNGLSVEDLPTTIINKTMSYGYQEQQILLPSIPNTNIDGGVIDLHNFTGGYGYLYIDLVGPGVTHLNSAGIEHAVGVLLVTPMGTFDVSSWENGGAYGDMAYMESQLFDLTSPANTLDNPFGFTLLGDPDVTYQTGDVLGSTAYGSWNFDFDSQNIASYAEQFFADNVTVNGQPLTDDNPLALDDLEANFIDKLVYNGVFNGITQQQLLFPSIGDTNIDHGLIDLYNFGGGFGYSYIDLVGAGDAGGDAVGAWILTPWDTYDVSWLAGPGAGAFDADAFDPSIFFPADGLEPPFNFWF